MYGVVWSKTCDWTWVNYLTSVYYVKAHLIARMHHEEFILLPGLGWGSGKRAETCWLWIGFSGLCWWCQKKMHWAAEGSPLRTIKVHLPYFEQGWHFIREINPTHSGSLHEWLGSQICGMMTWHDPQSLSQHCLQAYWSLKYTQTHSLEHCAWDSAKLFTLQICELWYMWRGKTGLISLVSCQATYNAV